MLTPNRMLWFVNKVGLLKCEYTLEIDLLVGKLYKIIYAAVRESGRRHVS